MGAPQIILVVLLALGTGIQMAEHGKPKTGKHNIGLNLVSTALLVGLLVWGGFFHG